MVSIMMDVALEDAVTAGARAAEFVALEEREVVVPNLEEVPAPGALPAGVAHAAALADALGGHEVRAMPVRGESPALAPVALGAEADAGLVQGVRLGPGRDEPTPAALVGGEDLVAAKLGDAEAAEDVLGSSLAGGGGRWCARLCGGHWGPFPLVRASGCSNTAGAASLSTPVFSHILY